jgi:putative holliday junction resolvase
MQTSLTTIIALDVGGQRIGVASANSIARIASPFVTLINTDHVMEEIKQLASDQATQTIVVGLPRGLSGQETDQTTIVRQFVEQLGQVVDVPLEFQDEALTSQKAEQELQSRGKPYAKGDIDALAATYILEDYLSDNPGAFA